MNGVTFAGYYRRYSNRLRRAMTARTGDPDEGEAATAAAFAAAWENIKRFRGNSRFYTYLHRIGVNDQIQNWRRHRRSVSLDALTAELRLIPRRPRRLQTSWRSRTIAGGSSARFVRCRPTIARCCLSIPCMAARCGKLASITIFRSGLS